MDLSSPRSICQKTAKAERDAGGEAFIAHHTGKMVKSNELWHATLTTSRMTWETKLSECPWGKVPDWVYWGRKHTVKYGHCHPMGWVQAWMKRHELSAKPSALWFLTADAIWPARNRKQKIQTSTLTANTVYWETQQSSARSTTQPQAAYNVCNKLSVVLRIGSSTTMLSLTYRQASFLLIHLRQDLSCP